jgi:hypothetical protein
MKKPARKTAQSQYQIQAFFSHDWSLPQNVKLSWDQQDLAAGAATYFIRGALDGPADAKRWKQPPHVKFVNLPLMTLSNTKLDPPIEEKAFVKFIEEYGVPRGTVIEPGLAKDEAAKEPDDFAAQLHFAVNSADVSGAQKTLRTAWKGESSAIAEIQRQVPGALQAFGSPGIFDFSYPPGQLAVRINQNGSVELVVKNLWSFVCLLFLRDYGAGRIGICANPQCPSPYFVKSRRTQKICEIGDCVVWAQRLYALKWWHKNRGKEHSQPPKKRKRK